MTLNKKVFLTIVGTVIILAGILYATASLILLRDFASLETRDASQNMARAQDALAAQLTNLDSKLSDWSVWDDAYAYMETHDPTFIQSNISDITLANLRLDLMLFVDTQGHILLGQGHDIEADQPAPISPAWAPLLASDDRLTRFPNLNAGHLGILLLPEGPMLIAAHPILRSDESGPAHGTLLFGRYLDDAEIKALGDRTHLSLSVYRLDDRQMPHDLITSLAVLSPQNPVIIRPQGAGVVAGYALLDDIYGQPRLVLGMSMPRQVYLQGLASLHYFAFALLLIGLAFAVVTMQLMRRFVLSPLAALRVGVQQIGQGRLGYHIPVRQQDEIGNLAEAFNDMATKLSERDIQVLAKTDELLALNQELEARISERTLALQAANEQLHGELAERKRAEQEITSLARFPGENPNPVLRVARDGTILYANAGSQPLLRFWHCQPGQLAPDEARRAISRVLESGVSQELEAPVGERILLLMLAPITDMGYVNVYGRDITDRHRADTRERNHAGILESLAQDASLPTILDLIIRSVEGDDPSALGSILLLDEQGEHLLLGAAPSLPDVFSQAMNGLKIGDGVGSCGTAAYTKRPVIVEDLLAHPYWTSAQTLVRQSNLRSCWSQPILSATGQVLGTFAIYHREPCLPGEDDLRIIKSAADLASLAIERKRAEEALRASEARFRSVVERLGEGVGNVDFEECFAFANPAAERIFGVSPGGLVGRNLREFTDDREWARIRQETTRRGQGEESGYELEIIRPDGRRCVLSLIATPWLDEHGRPLGTSGVFRDVTDQKRMEIALRESEALFRTLAETSAALIVIYQAGHFCYVNAAGVASLGYAADELARIDLQKLIHPDSLEVMPERIRLRQRGADVPERFELKVVTKSGPERWLELTVGHISYLGRPAVLGTAFDISERKWAVATLAEERSLLAQRVEAQTAELRAANAELARAAQLKDEFLANMSHELRTPLNAILGLSEALQEQVYGPVSERQLKSLATIEESGRHLLALINDILDLSKIEAGKMELQLEAVDVAAVCQASLQFIKQTAFKKRIMVNLAADSQVRTLQADARRLKQILVNLLSNAVKFTPEGGAIGLEVAGDVERGSVCFAVWDTGIGIAPDEMERIFQPFMQVDSSFTRQYAGTGLGLALVRRLADQHGGSITVESEPGHGSRFTVALPWHPRTHEPAKALEPETVPATPITALRSALVVEDSPSAAEQLVRYLAGWNIRTTVHTRANGIIGRVLAERPSVIILDILLPDGSGWELLSQLKADVRTRPIPVLIISVVDDSTRGLALGALAYLVKPITRTQLQAALTQVWSGEMTPKAGHALLVLPDQDESPGAGHAGTTILLAEDNETSIAVSSDYLEAKGYRMQIARNGEQAVALARQEQPELILMDIQMPGIDGLEAIRRIRHDGTSARVPIIALTALAMPGDRERCLTAGADAYLTKPVNLQRLVATIEELLHASHGPTEASDA